MTQSEKQLELQAPTDLDQNAGEMTEIYSPQERRVLSKFDKFVMPQMAILVLFAYLDRTNIGKFPCYP